MFPNLLPWDLPAAYAPAELVFRAGKWRTIKNGREWSATGVYIFVRMSGRFYVCKANLRTDGVGHIELSQGRPVEYAGEVWFAGRKKRGTLRSWNNASGHYQPSANAAAEAKLPTELFLAHVVPSV